MGVIGNRRWMLGMMTGLLGVAAVGAGAAAAAEAAGQRVMTRETFARYVDRFNGRHTDFVSFYAPDVVFDKGPPEGKLIGRQAIADWYANIWQDFDETITPLTIAIDDAHGIMLVELRTELVSRRDGVRWRDTVYQRGDRLIVDGTIVYTLHDGLITTIRGGSDERRIVRVGEESRGQ